MSRRSTILVLGCGVAFLLGLVGGCSEDPVQSTPAGVVQVKLEPYTLQAGWTVTGPGNFVTSDTGDFSITGRSGGDYAVTWSDLPGYITPPEETQTLLEGESLVFVGTYASTLWERQDSGTTEPLTGVSFVDPQVGTVVGMNGTILHTVDGGATWIAQDSGTDAHLYAVDFADANTGVAVGKSGTVLSTSDGGSTWIARTGLTSNDLTDIAMATASLGTAVGEHGTIRRTGDGGAAWTPQLADVYYYWSNGSWHVSYSHRIDNEIYGVDYGTNRDLTVVGDLGFIMRSGSSGIVWAADTTSTSRQALVDVACMGPDTTYAVGYEGTIQLTTDAGVTWASLDSGTDQYLYAVDFLDGDLGMVVGLGGTILRTLDGGATWASEIAGTFRFLMAVEMIDAETSYVVGEDGIILRTRVGGG